MSQFLDKLRNDISKLYENADDYNVLIEIGEGSDKKTFKAHSVILRSRCNFFHVALSNDWRRRDTENSEMMSLKKPNISPKVFEIILKETKDLLGLLQALDELGLEELFEYIQDFFIVHESKWLKDYLYQVTEKIAKLIPLIRFTDISINEFDEYVRPYDSILPKVLQSTPWRYTFSRSQLDNVPLALIPRKPPYHIDSLIIEPKEAALIANWIDPMEGKSVNGRIQFGNIKFHLLHRASQSSFSFECFHNKCDGNGPVIVLLKISSRSYVENNKEIIGGYNPVGWNSLDNYIETDHSFIFSFNVLFNKTMTPKISRVQQRCRKFAIYDGVKFGPSFGKGDLEFSCEETPDEGFCRQNCYGDPIRTTKDKFLIEEMEVFKVIKSRKLD
ncbi:13748_t:CDS:2 [Dentiscutata heterogama]|uniref:13748_t:CDS:1 n=1 Tax=Dentiscutata heterogama TaxID=1316150 RepID=A0ACA9LYR8_9GLOM|nr:13748_t:CDS:2 [Dentiscutata heterogama]